MSKELKVTYEDFKSRIKVVPKELVVKENESKYNRAKEKQELRKMSEEYINR